MGRLLITGATGFLGGALVRAMADAKVLATGRDVGKLALLPLPEDARLVADLARTPPEVLVPHCAGVTTIVHCAALSSPWGADAAFEAANVGATRAVIGLARALGVEHLVFISSPTVYFRFADQLDLAEDTALPPPVNAYARTKAIAEGLVRESGVPCTILRPRGIYGQGDVALLPRVLRAARSGALPLLRGGRAQTDLTHVDDVVAAIRAVLDRPDDSLGRTFNISGGQPLAIREIVERVCAATQTPLRWRALPVAPVLAAVRMNEAVARHWPGRPEPKITAYGLGIFAYSQTLDLTQARNALGWRPLVGLEEGLRRSGLAGVPP